MSVLRLVIAGASAASLSLSWAAVRTVGPGQQYKWPCAAIAAANDGDTIEIRADGQYEGDVCTWTRNGLTIRGVGGRAHLKAAGRSSQGKAIWVIAGNDTVIENIEFSGTVVPDQNGAGIRQEGRNLILRNCYFHDNQSGILSAPRADSEILIEYCEFARNGTNSYAHNIYIGIAAKFTLRHSYSHDTYAGHLVKSRAQENYILYNRLTNREGGYSDYEIDLPHGGLSYVIGNTLHQVGHPERNNHMMTYAMEGFRSTHARNLYIINNTFVDDAHSQSPFLLINTELTTPPVIKNNVFAGSSEITYGGVAVIENNFVGETPGFVSRGGGDYRPTQWSPLINTGTDLGTAGGVSLKAEFQYAAYGCRQNRPIAGPIDIGAYEYPDSPETEFAITCGNSAAGMSVSPSVLDCDADQETPPAERTVTITSPGGQAVPWQVEPNMLNGAGWLEATPASGAGGGEVRVSMQTSFLAPGVYLGEIKIRNGLTGAVAAVPVWLTLKGPAESREPRPGLRNDSGAIGRRDAGR